MKLPAWLSIGAATHTGLVRKVNEDDYLVLAPPDGRPGALVVAVADGMGGVVGGAEASRAGLRGLAAGLLRSADDGTDAAAAIAAGFAGASARVLEQARLLPALKDMGTTLTALLIVGTRAVLGHIGDSRAYRWRNGTLDRLTQDHASKEHANRLLRCIGAGQPAEAPDESDLDLAVGDRLLLCTDGVWGTVPEPAMADVLGRLPPQAAAEELLRLALRAGAPDNTTALVVQVTAPHGPGEHEQQLPTEETPSVAELVPPGPRLGAPRWPFYLLALAILLLAMSLVRLLTGFDVLVWLRSWLGGG